MRKLIYKVSTRGGCHFHVYLSDERNKNGLTVHSNEMGKTIYENNEVWDSDVLKLVRLLNENQYGVHFKDIFKIINKKCRHLKIEEWEWKWAYY